MLRRLTVASFDGSGQTSIQALATDLNGNIYVAGTTNSSDFPVKYAAQPQFGEASIMQTTDLGKTWVAVGNPPGPVWAVAADPISPGVIFAAGDAGIYKSTDGGRTWRRVYAESSGSLVIDPGNHLHLAARSWGSGRAALAGPLVRSLDGGETWTATGISIHQVCADPTGSGALLLVDSGNELVLSRDWGANFSTLNPPGIGPVYDLGAVYAMAFDASNRGWIHAYRRSSRGPTLSFSTDFGATWTTTAVPGTLYPMSSIAADPANPYALLAFADTLYVSLDGGASWTPRSIYSPGGDYFEFNATFAFPNRGCAPPGSLFDVGTTGVAGTGPTRVAFSSDYGASWKVSQPAPTQITGVEAGPGCSMYVTRQPTTDAFVAKLAPDGTVIWATYLGGSDLDTVAGLAVDPQGNAYVAGTTSSPDFPTTVPRIGVAGSSAAFVTKFSTEGRILYSTLIGGEGYNTATALAVDSGGSVYLTGNTNSKSFPVTAGPLVPTLPPGIFSGFLAKLSPDATVGYAAFLNFEPGPILVDGSGQVTMAGYGEISAPSSPPAASPSQYLVRVNADGSQVVFSAPIAIQPSALAWDNAGDLYVFGVGLGASVTAGAYHAPPPVAACGYPPTPLGQIGPPYTSVYVMKLARADWRPFYTASLSSPCGIAPGVVAVDSTGAAVLAMASDHGLPLRHPLPGGPACSFRTSALAKLSPDGSTLQFATYLDGCDAPALALAPNGSVYVGVSGVAYNAPASVLDLNTGDFLAVSLDGILNAFSGESTGVVPGALYTITGTAFHRVENAITETANPADDPLGRRRLVELPARSPLLRFAELAEVFRHGVGVALRDGLAAGAADAAVAGGLAHLAAKFHFHLLHARHERGVSYLLGFMTIIS